MHQTSMAFPDDGPRSTRHSHAELNLRKATGAIHIRNDISTLQRKVSDALLFIAGSQLGDMSIMSHQVSLAYLCKLTGFNSNNISHLKESIDNLVGTRIKWDIINPNGEHEWGVASLLADAVFRNGVVTFSFAPQLREKLSSSERWAPINMSVVRRFSSGPGLAMYENCVPYRGVGQTPFFKVDLLRELLGSTAESYDEFKVLNRSVLKPAIEEVNREGDLSLELEYKRERRQVVAVKIWITPKDKDSAESPAEVVVDERMLEQLTEDFCLGDAVARNILTEHPADKVQAIMEYVGDRYTKNQIRKGKVGPYFLTTLMNWDGSAVKESRLDAKIKSTTANAVQGEKPATAKQRAEQERQAVLAQERKLEAQKRLAMLDVDERVDLDARFEQFVRQNYTPVLDFLKKEGPSHPMVTGVFNLFLQKELLDPLPA